MQVLIKAQIKNIPVTSVMLGRDYDDPEGHRLHMFFCYNCQCPLVQYKGFVYQITTGDLRLPVGMYIKCDNCQRVYNIYPEVS